MSDISEIFGTESLTLEEFKKRADERGIEIGDIRDVRRGYEERICEIRCAAALEREIERAGVINADVLRKLIDPDAITVDDEGVHGIGEQIAGLRESDPYLFVPEKKNTFRSVMTGARHGGETLDHDKMSDADYYKSVKLI